MDSYEGLDDAYDARLTVLLRSFNVKIKRITLAYVPMAPEFTFGEEGGALDAFGRDFAKRLSDISVAIAPFLPKDTMCIRFDPDCSFEDLSIRDSFVAPFKVGHARLVKAGSDIQPPDTVLLDLERSEDEILRSMKSKWRYNIRLSQRKGVEVRSNTADDADFSEMFEAFYKLFMETSKRDRVQFHNKEYYLDLLKAPHDADTLVRLYMAKHEGDVLAGIIVLFYKKEAVYLYGASGNTKRNLMPAYLLQWNAICDAKDFGCAVYDLYGCPPNDNEKHPMHGLFLFKTGFGGRLVHRAGSFDFILKKADYMLYERAEKIRFWFYKVLKKGFLSRR